MCGRYTLTADKDTITKRFSLKDFQGEHSPRYNIAPAQTNPVVVLSKNQERIVFPMRWGLVPGWAKDEKIGYKMINARAETLTEKPSFKNVLYHRRCLVPADGYYEWQKPAKPGIRSPFRIVLKSRELFAFAGLWDTWKSGSEKTICTYTIITTEADEVVGKIHPRMPVILRPENEDKWMDPELRDTDSLYRLLNPYPANLMEMYEVSSLVGRANIDVEEFMKHIN